MVQSSCNALRWPLLGPFWKRLFWVQPFTFPLMSIETYGLSRGRDLPRWCTRCWENHCQNQLLWVKRAWNHCQNPEIGTTFFSNSSNQPKFTFQDEEKQLRIGIWIHKKKHNYSTSIIFYDLLQISVSPKIRTSGWLTRRSSIWGSRNKRSWSSFAWHPNKTTWSGVVERRCWGFFRVSADIFSLHFPCMLFVLSVNGWCFMLGSLLSHKPPTVTRNHWLDKIKILFFSSHSTYMSHVKLPAFKQRHPIITLPPSQHSPWICHDESGAPPGPSAKKIQQPELFARFICMGPLSGTFCPTFLELWNPGKSGECPDFQRVEGKQR